ncbi:MAG: IS1182 family transposase, partial [Bacteroidota bacterium]
METPEASPTTATAKQSSVPLKLKVLNRSQLQLVPLDVDSLIGPDHKARAIWDLSGTIDLSAFHADIRSQAGQPGRQHNDPRLLVSLWLYAYSEGISSARELSREMEHEPGLRWLAGLEVINHTTLSDFRKDHREGLDKIFTQLLAVMEGAGLVSLDQVMQDGTKIQAQASGNSFRREKTVRERLERAREVVRELGKADDEAKPSRRQAARRRAAEQQVERLQAALRELQEIQQSKHGDEEKAQERVSITEPEARMMKHGNDGGIAPSYNLQLTTDAEQKVIVNQALTTSSSDGSVKLSEVVDQVEANLDRKPDQLVADGAYTSRKNIIELADAGVDFIGSLPDREVRQAMSRKGAGVAEEFAGERFTKAAEGHALLCPAGRRLEYRQIQYKHGNGYEVYRAQGSDCTACEFHQRCCPKGFQNGRTVCLVISEPPEVTAFREKMQTPEAQQAYRKRAPVAESPNAWIKEKFGIRKFRLRGLIKAGIEALWAC